MLGLLKAAVLVAPVLELVLAAPVAEIVSSGEDVVSSTSLITLEFDGSSNNSALQPITLDLRVFESTSPCGYGNVTLNGGPLPQDDLGLGSGSIITDGGSTLVADWRFTCVQLGKDAQALLLYFQIISVDDQKVQDATFSVQFQQTAPVSVSYIKGARGKVKSLSATETSGNHPMSLEDELADLEKLQKQLRMVESAIALKIAHIAETFNLDQPQELLQAAACGSIKCFFGTIYDQMKGMASNLYHGGQSSPVSPLGNSHGLPSYDNENRGSQRPLLGTGGVSRVVSNPPPQAPERVSSPAKVESPTSTAHEGQPRPSLIDHGPFQVLRTVTFVIVGLTIIINVMIMILMIQCMRLLRQRRLARQAVRSRQVRASRGSCNTLLATKSMDLIRWLRDTPRCESIEDQEKDAAAGQVCESDCEQEDKLSITMEEEIARFRAATDFVTNLVTAEGERGRQHPPQYFTPARPRRASTPSSIRSACPTYRSVDESLPAYDENCSPEYAVDGFEHTPDDSTSASSISISSGHESAMATRSPLDEDAEKAA
ncbi:hypothetical protein F4861DRAFT_5040 [Xylaria intraflava]|nr:hypothetical protein F4861DRAFT_5040 [Xylaria intraflava]